MLGFIFRHFDVSERKIVCSAIDACDVPDYGDLPAQVPIDGQCFAGHIGHNIRRPMSTRLEIFEHKTFGRDLHNNFAMCI
jgi:hypothetical protein